MMEKDIVLTQKIVRLEPQQTGLTRCMRTLWAWLSRRPIISASVPPRSIVCYIVDNFLRNLANSLFLVPDIEPNIYLSELLPADTTTIELRLRKSIYDHGWVVLRRNKEGKAVKAVWLLKVSPNEARLALYVSRPRWPQKKNG